MGIEKRGGEMSRLTDPENRACFYCDRLKECDWDNTYDDCITVKYYDKLQHYEDLEEQGRLIEVVRCKNCIRHNTSIMVIGFGWCDVWNQVTHDDGYCSRAEAKLAELKGE